MNEWVTDPTQPHLGGNRIGGDPNSYYPVLWDWLVSYFGIHTVLDVGCGEGRTTRYFNSIPGCQALGIDGLAVNVEMCGKAIAEQHDLTKGPYLCRRFNVDLVWCCEVVEHVEERYLYFLLTTLLQGDLLAMTHAVPGQLSHHHVNCQLPEYWLKHITQRGFVLLKEATEFSRTKGHEYWPRNGLIFCRAGSKYQSIMSPVL